MATATGRILIEIFFDGDTQRWDFEVPQLHIVGTGGPTREDARHRAAEAIAVTLGGRPDSGDDDGEAEYLNVAFG